MSKLFLKSNQNGFTLIEMLVYVSVSSVIITGILVLLVDYKNKTESIFSDATRLLVCIQNSYLFKVNPMHFATSSNDSSSSTLFDIYYQNSTSTYHMFCKINQHTLLNYVVNK